MSACSSSSNGAAEVGFDLDELFDDLYGAPEDPPAVIDEKKAEDVHLGKSDVSPMVSLQALIYRLLYVDRLRDNVTSSFSNQMTKEVQRREADKNRSTSTGKEERVSTTKIVRVFRFDHPLEYNKEPLFQGEVRHLNMEVDPDSQQKVMDLLNTVDLDLERAVFFKGYPKTIFFLPGKREFAMVPGLIYSFLASPTLHRTNTEQDLDDPLSTVDLYNDGLKSMYIVKKSLQWDVLPLRTPMVITIFRYFIDMIMATSKNKTKATKSKKTKGKSTTTDQSKYKNIAQEAHDDPSPSMTDDVLSKRAKEHLEEEDIKEESAHGYCTMILDTLEEYVSRPDFDPTDDDEWTREKILELVTGMTEGQAEAVNPRYPKPKPFDSEMKYGKLLTMIFCHETAKCLYPYYSKSKILRIPAGTLENMKAALMSTPSLFCFYGAYVLFITDSKKRLITNLPELPEEKFEDICESMNLKVSKEEKLAVYIYRLLKDECVTHGHKFIVLWQVYERTGAESMEMFDSAIEYLVDHKAIVVTPNPIINTTDGTVKKAHEVAQFDSMPDSLVYLSITYISERMIRDGYQSIFRNYKKGPPILMDNLRAPHEEGDPHVLRSVKYDPSTEPKKPTVTKCSEQLATVEHFARYPRCPVPGLDGWGGSGKTTTLWAVLNLYPPNSTILLTAQAANAAACREKVTLNSMTMFMMAMMHTLTCPKSPYYDANTYNGAKIMEVPTFSSKKEREAYRMKLPPDERLEFDNPMEMRGFRFPKGKCFLHHVQTLVVDEISLVDDEIYATVLSILSTCGDLKQVLICGDHRQKPQISYGCLMEDLVRGLPVIEYKHCHRFQSGSLFMNAKAIHERNYDEVRFDDQRYKMIEIDEMKTYSDDGLIIDELGDVMRKNRIEASVDNMLITRTNRMRRIIGNLARESSFGDSNHFHRGQKIYLNVTDYSIPPPVFISKQILVVSCILDMTMPDKCKKSTMSREAIITARTEIVAKHNSTASPVMNFQLSFRLIIAVPLGKDLDDQSQWIRIPFFGHHKRTVADASCLTLHFVQGFETKHVVVFHTSQWDTGDTNRGLFAAVTRGAESVTFVSNHTMLEKMCKNKDKPRDSVLWAYLKEMNDTNTEQFLKKYHNTRRKMLRREGKTPGNYSPMFHLQPDPTNAQLNIPPSEIAQKKAREEGDMFDAAAMVRKFDAEKAAAIARKQARAAKRRKRAEEREVIEGERDAKKAKKT